MATKVSHGIVLQLSLVGISMAQFAPETWSVDVILSGNAKFIRLKRKGINRRDAGR